MQNQDSTPRSGPLCDLRVLEFTGIGPAPFAGMLLADLGADVVRIDRPSGADANPYDVLARGRRSLALDLKQEADRAIALAMLGKADILIEGFRPGVMERLGLGPDIALARNPRLIYGRMTGWGQMGPLAQRAGHDINYIALAGALAMIGPADHPTPPLNLVGDFGGGALYLVMGVLAAHLHAQKTGIGQVVDCAMTDGAASLLAMFHGFRAMGFMAGPRGANLLDGGAHFYRTYQCADGRFIAVGAIEPQFYAALREKLGLTDDPAFDAQMDATQWPALSARLSEIFRQAPRDHWAELFATSDACVTPVLEPDEAISHPHIKARRAFVEIGRVTQPGPAPRFSVTPGAVRHGPVRAGEGGRAAMHDWGLEPSVLNGRDA